jgi:hypothetical protein
MEFEEGGEKLTEDFWIEGLVSGKSRSYLTGLGRREEGEGQMNQRKREMPAPYRSSGGFLGNSARGGLASRLVFDVSGGKPCIGDSRWANKGERRPMRKSDATVAKIR